MSGSGGGPPNKWAAFSTADMTRPEEFAQALSALWAQGFTGEVVTVPSPVNKDATWVAIGSYAGHS